MPLFRFWPNIPGSLVTFYYKTTKRKIFIPVKAQKETGFKEEEEDFEMDDFETKSLEHGIVWLNPNRSKEELAEFNKLSVCEKRLWYLIGKTYPKSSDQAKANKLYFWQVEYLSCLSEIEQRKFLFENPNLPSWEDVFKRGTAWDNIVFNIYFLSYYKFVLEPNLWAGQSLKHTLVLYYLFLTKKYIVYVESEKLLYQYDGKRWQIRSSLKIISELIWFTADIRIKSVDKTISSTGDWHLIESFQSAFTIKKWPFVMGRNFNNGFLTLKNGLYTLYPHGPRFWQKELIKMDIPHNISVDLEPNVLRLLLDWSGEDIIALGLIKLMLCLVTEQGNHNLIFNLNGMPWGAKTLLVDLIKEIVGENFASARFESLNSFNREAALVNVRVLVFSDANPKNLDSKSIDVLKALSGRDPIHVEEKFGQVYDTRCNALIILTNNENFEGVKAFKEEAMSDRVLNIELPAIKSDSSVPGLKEKLGQNACSSLFFFGQTTPPEILAIAQRSGDLNAITGSGNEKIFIQFLIQECIFVEGEKTEGKTLHQGYTKFLKKELPKAVPIPITAFYSKLDYYLDKMTPKPVTRKKRKTGQVYSNIAYGRPGDKVKFSYKNFTYSGSTKVRSLLEENPLIGKAIAFQTEKGDYIFGPRINPEYAKKIYENLLLVKNTSLKKLIFGESENAYQKHFEETGFGGDKKIDSLTAKDFLLGESISYQPTLQYDIEDMDGFLGEGVLVNSLIGPYLSGQKHAFLAKLQEFRPGFWIEGMSSDFYWASSFSTVNKLFINEVGPTDDYLKDLDQEAEALKIGKLLGPKEPVKLEIYQPGLQENKSQKPKQIAEEKQLQPEVTTIVKLSKGAEKPFANETYEKPGFSDETKPRKRGRPKKIKQAPPLPQVEEMEEIGSLFDQIE